MGKKTVAIIFIIAVSAVFFAVFPYWQKAKVVITCSVEQQVKTQVFWKTKRQAKNSSLGYTEQDSGTRRIAPGDKGDVFYIPSLKKIARLRVDPADRETEFVIHSIVISQLGFDPIVFQSEDDWTSLSFIQQLRSVDGRDNYLLLESTGKDPGFELKIDGKFHYFRYCKQLLNHFYTVATERMDLLGLSLGGFFLLIIDCLVLFSISATIFLTFLRDQEAAGEVFVGVGIIFLSTIILSVITLGAVYKLTALNLLISHVFLWFAVHYTTAKLSVKKIAIESYENIRKITCLIYSPIKETLFPKEKNLLNIGNSFLLFSILFLILFYLLPAAFTLPLNYDSNDYRLSRVGFWLQEHHVWQFATNDIRQVLMPANCDFAMLWITSFFKKGYPFVHLISLFGGLLISGALFSFLGSIGLKLHYRLLSIVFWFGIPNSASQMLTSQTDLFTTGCLIAGLLFLFHAIRDQKLIYYVLAGLGIGLGVGSKSTVFLWGPGLGFVLVCLVFFYRKKLLWPVFVKGMSVLICALVITGGFVYAQNQIRFGNFLGPKRTIESIKDADQAKVKDNKKGKRIRNLTEAEAFIIRAKMYTYQVFEPSSTLKVLHPVSNFLFDWLEKDIREKTEKVKGSFLRRFNTATRWFRGVKMSEDYTSFGLIPFSLFCLGGIVALMGVLRNKGQQSMSAATLFISSLLYMLFFCYIVGWTAHRYRYAVLITPFLAIIGIYLLASLEDVMKHRRRLAVIPVLLVFLYQFTISVNIAYSSRTHGWRSFISPSKAHSYVHYWYEMDQLVKKLPEQVNTVGLFLSKGSWKALFFRTGREIKSDYIASTEALDINDELFKQRGIDALVSKNLSSIFIQDSYNLVSSHRSKHYALVKLEPGEKGDAWLVKRGIWNDGWMKTRGKIILGNWQLNVFTVEFCNQTPKQQELKIKSSEYPVFHQIFKIDECQKVKLKVKQNDQLKWTVRPGYNPREHGAKKDNRLLGLKITMPDY